MVLSIKENIVATSYTAKVQAVLRDKHPVRFREILDEVKANHPFDGDRDSYRDVTRYNSYTYNTALRLLAIEHPDEYVIEMRKFSPTYKKTVYPLQTIKINIYDEFYTVASGQSTTESFTRITDVTKYVTSLLKEMNK